MLDTSQRSLEPGDSLVQLLLTEKDKAYISCNTLSRNRVCWNMPFPWPLGAATIPIDKAPPATAYKKLYEILALVNTRNLNQKNCVELGSAPGGWTHVLLEKGATVISVDRAPMPDYLLENPNLSHHRADAKKWMIKENKLIDWLFGDLALAPDVSLDILQLWIKHKAPINLVWTLKFVDKDIQLDTLKKLQFLNKEYEFITRHLQNHGNELVVLGIKL